MKTDYILTMRGWVPAKTVSTNDFVLTHKNKWQRVLTKTVTYFDHLSLVTTSHSLPTLISDDLMVLQHKDGSLFLPRVTGSNDSYKITKEQWTDIGENYFNSKSNVLVSNRTKMLLSSNLLSLENTDLLALVQPFYKRVKTLKPNERLFLLCAHLRLNPPAKVFDTLVISTGIFPKAKEVIVLDIEQDKSWFLNGLCVSF